MNKLVTFLCICSISTCGITQTISGNLSLLPNQSIKLEGFNGLKTYPISFFELIKSEPRFLSVQTINRVFS